jgi:probable F420-dependent oxidoreductase
MRIGITLPSRTGALSTIIHYARQADEAGFHSIWDYEVYRNPFTMLAGAAVVTSQAELGTGLAAAFTRSPFEAANAAADVDELSGGRMLFGIGTGVPEFLQAFHSTDANQAVARMSEYIDVLRASWEYLGTGQAGAIDGSFYQFAPPPINPWGNRPLARPGIPIYLAAMGPQMLRLCGRKADGWIGYFATPKFLEEYVRPEIAAGAAKAGRDPDTIDVCAETICCVHPDRDVAIARARRQVGFYVVHPVSNRIAEMHGLLDDVAALRGRMMQEGIAAFEHTSDALVETLSISGTPEECRHKLDEYAKSIDHIALHTPYVPPFGPEDSADAFAQILAAFGPATAAQRPVSTPDPAAH